MIGLSPFGIIDALLIFPTMLLLGLALDIVGVVLACFGLDDFGILDIVGLVVIGGWLLFRSGGERQLGENVQMPPGVKEKKAAIKKGSKLVKRLAKVGLRVLIIGILEFIPYIGAILFGWTLLVLMEFVSDFRTSSLEAGD
jgi:hypothetical protein